MYKLRFHDSWDGFFQVIAEGEVQWYVNFSSNTASFAIYRYNCLSYRNRCYKNAVIFPGIYTLFYSMKSLQLIKVKPKMKMRNFSLILQILQVNMLGHSNINPGYILLICQFKVSSSSWKQRNIYARYSWNS